MSSKLGIIAGSGELPKEIAKLQKEIGDVFVAAVDSSNSFEGLNHKYFCLGEVGKIIDYFKENSVQEIIIIGGVKRPDFKSLNVDFAGGVLISKIVKQKILGDDNLLKIVSDYIESKGFKVVSPKKLLQEREVISSSITSNQKPSSEDKVDIELGAKVIKSLGDMDVGQSVIVCDGYVIGVEAAEGTDKLIERCFELRKQQSGGVLVKMSKTSQDMRFDIPVIGPKTAQALAQSKFSGIAIEKEGVIIINPSETKNILDKNKMFLFYL